MNDNITAWLTPMQAAARLGVTEKTLRNFIAHGKLRAVMTEQGTIVVDPESIDRLAAKRLKKAQKRYEHMEESNITNWLTPTQAAARLGVSAQTIRVYVAQGKLRAVMTAHGRLVDPESVERLAEERLKRKQRRHKQ